MTTFYTLPRASIKNDTSLLLFSFLMNLHQVSSNQKEYYPLVTLTCTDGSHSSATLYLTVVVYCLAFLKPFCCCTKCKRYQSWCTTGSLFDEVGKQTRSLLIWWKWIVSNLTRTGRFKNFFSVHPSEMVHERIGWMRKVIFKSINSYSKYF